MDEQRAHQSSREVRWRTDFLPLLTPWRGRIALAGFAMLLDALFTLCRPWPLKVVIDRVIAHQPKHTRVPFIGGWLDNTSFDRLYILYGACAATLAIATSTGLLTYYYTWAMGTIGQRFGFALRRNLFAHLQRLSLRFHDRQRTGDLTTRLTSDIQNVQDVVANGAIVLINNGVLLAGMMGLMLWLNACFALAALSVSPLLFATIFRYTHRIKVAARAARTSDGLLASVAQETLAAMRVVQGLAQEDQQNDRFAAQNANSMHAYLEGIRYQARVAPLVDFLAAAGLAVVMWYGATRAMSGGLTTGDVVVFFAYVTNLYSPMKQLAKLSYAYNRASIGAERIGEVMRVRCEVIDSPKSPAAPLFSGRIEFRNVHFEYDPGQPILRGINLQLEAGERVALVGHSGAGKSTLASLVPRLYDPTSGAVLIDGIDIRSVRLNSLREQISLVLQDSLLFRGTIRENIAFGRPEASDHEIKQAAVAANADHFISQLPEGYATIVAERGTTLSGGQKQRIAIARAIIRNAAILILDEPTSGLDVASERAVIEALERAAENRTTLMIAHRLSTVRFADRISVMEEGRIVEEGAPTDLLRRNSRYAQLFKSQFAAA